jgi:adenine-specific DNA-methyltransferase
LVLAMTEKGDKVFDPYMGAGSTIIAAMKQDRVGYGCDIEQEYVHATLERIRAFQNGTLRTRPMDKPVYDPELPYGGHR